MRLSFRGRRSQGGFGLNSLDYGVFGASKYGVKMFLSLIGPNFLAGFLDLLRNRLLFGLFNGSAKPYNIILVIPQKLKIISFSSL